MISLDSPLPRELAVGRGTALFINGWCFSKCGRIRSLEFVIDGSRQPVAAHGMPRLDVFRSFHPRLDPFGTSGMTTDLASQEDPHLHSYRSGFWGIARVPPSSAGGTCELALRAELDDGDEAIAELWRVETAAGVDAPEVPSAQPADGPLVAICMATYEPPIELFERQVRSIQAQTHSNWICLVSDDCSSPGRFAELRERVGGDPRFVVSRGDRRLGFYRNFERALAMAPASARYVAMADQDDVWYPQKLEVLLDEIGNAQLVYSDARVVDGDGRELAGTYWDRRRNNHSNLLSLLVANAVTGAASLFRRELLEQALPFPPEQFAHFHDHWIGLTALALGEIAFVDRPLYDYVQHGTASLGHAEANRMPPSVRERFGSLRRDPAERVRMWRMHYFADACRLLQFATVLTMRCAEEMKPRKRRVLERFLKADRSLLSVAHLARRGLREVIGLRTETLGAEWMLSHAFVWRRLLAATVRDRPQRRLRLDAVPPPNLAQKPGVRMADSHPARALAEKIAPLELAYRDDAPPRVNVLIPTIDLEHFFGGYIAKFNLARRLQERGIRTRIVTVDPVGPLPPSWRSTVESYAGLGGFFDDVEVVFGRESSTLEASRSDRFVATTWWTAHVAADVLGTIDADRFLYLIQEFEPFTFPMGTLAALASESYAFPHYALFSTELLRDYFRRHRLGVYADDPKRGDERSAAFENAITPVDPPSADELANRTTRRLLFYARPEPHAARNLFELGVLALSRALQSGVLGRDWELCGVGAVDAGRQVPLDGDTSISVLPRTDQDAYASLLRRHDVGLALMYTPHPSLAPIEMASAGMVTVTNSFESKTPEAMTAISPNIITAEPSVDGIVAGLREATAAVDDFEGRVRGSDVRWSRDWNESFDDELMARLTGFLGV